MNFFFLTSLAHCFDCSSVPPLLVPLLGRPLGRPFKTSSVRLSIPTRSQAMPACSFVKTLGTATILDRCVVLLARDSWSLPSNQSCALQIYLGSRASWDYQVKSKHDLSRLPQCFHHWNNLRRSLEPPQHHRRTQTQSDGSAFRP